MKTLSFLAALLLTAPSWAQSFKAPNVKFDNKGSAEQAAADKSRAQAVAEELGKLASFDFVKNDAKDIEGGGVCLKGSSADGQVRQCVILPLLAFLASVRTNPYQAVDIERKYWEARGWGFDSRPEAKEKINKAVEYGGQMANSGTTNSPDGAAAGYRKGSDALVDGAILPNQMGWYIAALLAYKAGATMVKEYKMEADNDEFKKAKQLRAGYLHGLGFINTDDCYNPSFGPTPQLVEKGSGFYKLRNAKLFMGLTAAIVYDGVGKGVLPSAPGKAELKAAMADENGGFGFDQLAHFAAPYSKDDPKPAPLVGNLRDQAFKN